MNIEEIRELINTKKIEARGFLEKDDIKNAEKVTQEVRDLQKKLDLALELEEREKTDLENQKDKEIRGKNMEKINEMRAIVKQLYKKDMTEEERATITTVDNSAIIPKEFVNKLIEIKKGYGSLKGLCDVIPVTKNEGTIPVVDLDQNELLDVLEGDDIVDGTLVTTDVPFKCVKVGLIQTLTSELVDDAEIEIENLVNKNFAEISTAKENKKILDVIKTNATVIEGATDYEDLENAIDSSLPSVKNGLITLTNVTGYVYLKNMKDAENRPLNLITEINGVEYFHGKPIVHVEDSLLPITELKSQVFYIANMKEAVKYCNRKGVTVARSVEAGFSDDTVKIRILERFIPVKGSIRSVKKIEF